MRADFAIMTENHQVPVLQLRRLLYELRDLRPDICIRFRLIGEMWQVNFYHIVSISEKGAALNDEKANKLIFISDLSHVMQFEIDHSFKEYEPHFHYTVGSELVH
jgi:hypothetical protein